MSIVFNQETGLFEYAGDKQNESIDIKTIKVGESLKIQDREILKFMTRTLHEDKIKMGQKIQDLEIRLVQAVSSVNFDRDYDLIAKCGKCDIIYHRRDKDFDSDYYCFWCEYEHCGKCLPVKKCKCGNVFSEKCADEDWCGGDECEFGV